MVLVVLDPVRDQNVQLGHIFGADLSSLGVRVISVVMGVARVMVCVSVIGTIMRMVHVMVCVSVIGMIMRMLHVTVSVVTVTVSMACVVMGM